MTTDWATVYEQTYDDLVRFLYRKVWDVDQAQDFAQEAFVRALTRDPARPKAWLFTVALNLVRDDARQAARHRHLTLARARPDPAPDPASVVERREQTALVRAALDWLTERDRDVLLLWDAGLDYDEIAEQTGLARGAIGTTLARARKRLIEAYAAMEGRDHDAALG